MLKVVVFVVLAPAMAFLALAYGLYFLGARDIPDAWRPTAVVYPESGRRAWWRIETGSEPMAIEAVSPPGMV